MASLPSIVHESYLHCKDGHLRDMILSINSGSYIRKKIRLGWILYSLDSFIEVATQNNHLHIIDYLINKLDTLPKSKSNLFSFMKIAIDNKNMNVVNYYLSKKRKIVEKWIDYHFIKLLCSNNQTEVLKCLVHNKYNINQKRYEFSEYSNFIDACYLYSADVLRVYFESKQELSLHLNIIQTTTSYTTPFIVASSRNDLEIVKLMLQLVKLPYKNKLLAFMCEEVNEQILEYLLGLDTFTQQEKIEAMELFGARQQLRGTMSSKTYKYWKLSLKKRKELNFSKTVAGPNEVFYNAVEFRTLDELKKLKDFHDIYTQTVLVEERLLGPMAFVSIFHITNWGKYDFTKKRFRMAFMRWFYILENLKCYSNPISGSNFQFYETVELFIEKIENLHEYKKTDVSFILKNLLQIARIIYVHVDYIIRNQRKKLTEQGLDCLIHYFKLISKIVYNKNYLINAKNSQSVNELKSYTKMILRLKPNDESDRNLIISAFKFDNSELTDENHLVLLQLADLFIECKINPNTRDKNNLTLIVHIFASYTGIEIENDYKHFDRLEYPRPNNRLLQNKKLIEKFVDYGAHLDIKVADNLCAYDYLVKYGLKCKIIKPKICLKCLCANAIHKYRIAIKNLPSKVIDFVNLHKPLV